MCLPEVGERFREYVSMLPVSTRLLSWVRGAMFRRGGVGEIECPVQEIEIRAFAKDMNASTGSESLGFNVPIGKSHEDLRDLGEG